MAKQSYLAHDFEKAFSLYSSILKPGEAVLFNMGASLFHQNKHSQALAHWHRARKEASFKTLPLIDAAIAHAEQLYEHFPKSWYSPIWNFIERVSLLISLAAWQIIILGLIVCFLFMHFRSALTTKKMILFFMFISAISCIAYARHSLAVSAIGFVCKADIQIKVAPDDSFESSCTLSYGSKLEILQKEGQWYKIRHHACVGWAKAEDVAFTR